MGAGNNETTTKFNVDISELKKGIQDAGRQIRLANSEFKAASSGMKSWETSSDGLTAKLNQLKTTLTSQKTILSNLEQQYAAVCAEQGENSTAAQNLAIRINNQQAAINKTEAAMNDYEGALNTVQQAEAAAAKNGTTVEEELKKIAAAADEADKETTDAANGGFTVLKGALANLAANAVMAAVNGLKELGSAVVDVGKQAIASYANYEQLAGGVETLFGAGGQSLEEYAKSVGKSVKDVEGEYKSMMTAQSTVMKNANDAYKTAGLSANAYMETVTSFSASLISSLGGDTEKAAGVADQAIIDMADNANKMGTSIGDIQNAYQGFAKQNYTMLDNLKLGYGGTKEEMQRLLTDAEALTGKKFDISNFADITEAIHAVQTEMGITGTTAKEASTTIEGSVNSMKSAWQNFLTGLAAGDEMDLSQLINNLVDSVATVGKNVLPRLNTTIDSMAQAIPVLVSKLFPMVMDVINTNLPTIIDGGAQVVLSLITGIIQALPGLTTAAGQIITSLLSTLSSAIPQVLQVIIAAIPQIITAIMQALPQIIQACYQFVTAIVAALPDIISALIDALPTIITAIVNGLIEGVDMLVQGAITLFTAIITAIPQIVTMLAAKLPDIINTIINAVITALPTLLQAAVKLFTEIVNAIPKIIPPLVKALPKIITNIVQVLTKNIPLILKTAITLFNALVDALPTIITALTKELPSVISTIVTVLLDNLPTILQAAITLFMEILKAIPKIAAELIKNMPKIIKAIVTGLKNGITSVADVGKNLIKGLWNGISDMAGWIKEKIQGFGKGVLDALKGFFGIKSPSRVMRDQVGKNIALGVIAGVDGQKKNAKKSAEELANLYISSAKSRVSELKKANKITEAQDITFWQTIASQTKKGTKAYNTAVAQIATAKNKLNKDVASLTKTYASNVAQVQSNLEKDITKLESDLATKTSKYVEDVEKVNSDLQSNIEKLEKTYADTVRSRQDSIANSLGLFSEVKLDDGIAKDVLTDDLQQQIDALDQWDNVLNSLSDRIGANKGLYKALSSMGVSSLSTLQNINDMSDEELQKYIELYDKKQEIALRRSITDNAELKAQTDQQIKALQADAQAQLDVLRSEYEAVKAETEAEIAKTNEAANNELATLKSNYVSGLKALGVTTKKQSGSIGKAIVNGIKAGLKSGTKGLNDELKNLANSMVAVIKKELKIKSPSRVMRDQVGRFIAEGIAEGITQNQDAVNKAMKAIMDDISNPVDFGPIDPKLPRYPSGGAGGAGAMGQGETSNYTFNQYNTSPKPLSRLEIYRQTNNILNYAKGV